MALGTTKSELRTYLRGLLRKISPEQRKRESFDVCSQLLQMKEYKSAKAVGAFLSIPGQEIDTEPFLIQCFKDQKKIYLPKCLADGDMIFLETYGMDDVNKNFQFNKQFKKLKEPPFDFEDVTRQKIKRKSALDCLDLDLMVIPGLGFTTTGLRIGYGVGHYDRFFQKYKQKLTEIDEKESPTRETSKITFPFLVGIGLSCQIVEHVPTEKHDHRLGCIISPKLTNGEEK
ncbi:hypothetical protein RFI_13332 [Reticulomyxa filosa]|uniref:5-formyltetrahydrofolate cyclo-ligase n=1 Tax=Reticulomyxa filosa TaxID=46433 RepID=X6ND69_RETFI|nr:hypothetical protein RFI_13332 [Reticulomyxa filosa]|eukprot:ETO23838.1 hypothetical protein RFI_13332 [Reticulomyxa filosa]